MLTLSKNVHLRNQSSITDVPGTDVSFPGAAVVIVNIVTVVDIDSKFDISVGTGRLTT